MAGNPQSGGSGGPAGAHPGRGYPVDHGNLEAGDTFMWWGQRLRLLPGAIGLGAPMRELTLRVAETETRCPCRCHASNPTGHSCTECFHTHASQEARDVDAALVECASCPDWHSCRETGYCRQEAANG